MVSTTVYKGKEVTDKQGLSQNLKGVRTSLILATNPLKEDGGGEREWPHLTTRKAGAMATISLDDIKNETVDLVRTHLAVHFCIFFSFFFKMQHYHPSTVLSETSSTIKAINIHSLNIKQICIKKKHYLSCTKK
jgi:hypothetical protein